MKNIRKSSFATYIGNFFFLVHSKLSAMGKSKFNQESQTLENYQLEDYQPEKNSQQSLHPYLVDRVEPSVEHIIFSSYIRF